MSLRLKCHEKNEENDQLKNCEPEVMACDCHMGFTTPTINKAAGQ